MMGRVPECPPQTSSVLGGADKVLFAYVATNDWKHSFLGNCLANDPNSLLGPRNSSVLTQEEKASPPEWHGKGWVGGILLNTGTHRVSTLIEKRISISMTYRKFTLAEPPPCATRYPAYIASFSTDDRPGSGHQSPIFPMRPLRLREVESVPLRSPVRAWWSPDRNSGPFASGGHAPC